MKKLIKYFILLTIAAFVGIAIGMHSGYVLIAYGNTVIETTLWIAVFFLLCGFLLIYAILRSSNNIYHLPRTISNFIKRYRIAKSQRYFAKGLHRLLENDWIRAENRFAQAISLQPKNNVTLTAYLAAAVAANNQHLHKRRDNYLNNAQKIYSGNTKAMLSIAFTRIHLLLQNQQYEEALALICHLRQSYPRHKLLLRKLQLIYVQQKDWRNLQVLLPLLFRYKILAKEELINLQKKVYLELWLVCLATKNEKKIKQFWRKLPHNLRYDADLLDPYISFLETTDDIRRAERLLLRVLYKKWQPKLVTHYGLLTSPKPWKQLKTMEHWFKAHPQDAALLLAISRICKRQMLIGKAKYYLEQYLKYSPTTTASAYQELGEIMESLGDKESALKFYRKGLTRTTINDAVLR